MTERAADRAFICGAVPTAGWAACSRARHALHM